MALVLGASHTTCIGNAGAKYCDTTASPWAILAVTVGAIIGGVVAAAVVRYRMARAVE